MGGDGSSLINVALPMHRFPPPWTVEALDGGSHRPFSLPIAFVVMVVD